MIYKLVIKDENPWKVTVEDIYIKRIYGLPTGLVFEDDNIRQCGYDKDRWDIMYFKFDSLKRLEFIVFRNKCNPAEVHSWRICA